MKQFLPSTQYKRKHWSSIRRYSTFLFLFFFSLAFQTLKAQTGEALNFDGVDNYVDISSVPLSGSYTKEVWIYLPVVDASYHNIISGSATFLYVYQGKLFAGQGSNFTVVQDGNVLLPNTWYHVAVTYDVATGTMTLYKNGTLVNSGTAPAYSETTLLLGALYNGSYAYFFQGTMDDARIWNFARSPVEILADYACLLIGTEGNLEALYQFNQGVAGGNNSGVTTLNDITPNGHNGTLVNFALTGTTSNWVAPGAPFTGVCVVLPVQLSNFTVAKSANGVKLNWETATEINNKGFEIQRSVDGINNWADIAFISGAGNTNEKQTYSYNDLLPLKGNNYYRLKQINFDGQSTYSSIKTIRVAQLSQLTLYPTLAQSNIILEVGSADMLNTIISVYDGQGRMVQQEKLINQKQQIDISNLQKGMYTLKLQNGASERFIKL